MFKLFPVFYGTTAIYKIQYAMDRLDLSIFLKEEIIIRQYRYSVWSIYQMIVISLLLTIVHVLLVDYDTFIDNKHNKCQKEK